MFYYYKGASLKEAYLNLKLLTMKDVKKIFLPLIASSLLIWSTFATNSVSWNWTVNISWQADNSWNVSGQTNVNWSVSSTSDNSEQKDETTNESNTKNDDSTDENESTQENNSNQTAMTAQGNVKWEVSSDRKGFHKRIKNVRESMKKERKRIKNVRESMKKERKRIYKFVTKKLQKRIDTILENKLFKRIAKLSQQKQELVLNKISKKVDRVLNIINSRLEKNTNNRWLKVKKEILEYLKEKIDQKLAEIQVSWSVNIDTTINWVLWK